MSQHTLTEIHRAWLEEAYNVEWDSSAIDAADCAELADELALFALMAEEDESYWEKFAEWEDYILSHNLWLPLEQCCHEGVLLPMEQRELRIMSCPPEMLVSLGHFFHYCPAHVMHRLALNYWVMVRAGRAEQTGSPDWRPGRDS